MFNKIEQGKLLYLKIFPSIFTQDMLIEVLKLLKVDQELIRQILLLSNCLSTRVSLFTKMCELQRSQIFSRVLICLEDCPYQVSCLPLQVCSVNCSNAWKSIVLGQKSIVAQIQSIFKIFGQHQHI